MSVSRASPGPLTTQPITDTVIGVVMWANRCSSTSTVLITLNCWRAQLGQEITVTPRRRRFSDFSAAMEFANRVAEAAEAADHHPDILINYNKVKLTLTTHSEGGLTSIDFDLANDIEQTIAY